MTDEQLAEALSAFLNEFGRLDAEALRDADLMPEAAPLLGVRSKTFREGDLLTRDSGVLVQLADGSQWELTVKPR